MKKNEEEWRKMKKNEKESRRIKKNQEEWKIMKKIESGIPQGNVLVLLLYLLYQTDLPTRAGSRTAIFENSTNVLVSRKNNNLAW